MNLLDPRQFLLQGFCPIDGATAALLARAPSQATGGGKMIGGSFRISDILDSSADDKANTSGETESEGEGRPRAGSADSGRMSPLGKKARKARTIFTDKQLQELEATFEKHKYLSVQDRMDLAQRMGLSDTQVKTWYQNRRTKWKRQASVGIDLLNEAGNMAAVQQLLRTNPYWAQYFAQSGPFRSFPIPPGGPMTNPLALPLFGLMPSMPPSESSSEGKETSDSPSQ